MKIKAKDPLSDGTIDVELPVDDPRYILYAKVCNDCSVIAGGGFTGPGLPEPYIHPRAVCPGCGGNNLRIEMDHGDEA